MSNCIINWRFGAWHFKILRDDPWITFTWNEYHSDWKAEGRPFFERY